MFTMDSTQIIGIDHGYGNIKTAGCVFPTGVMRFGDKPPAIGSNILRFLGRYYLIGEGHKEFTADKMNDDDFYILTLAAIANELSRFGITEANVRIASGLPLTWLSQQKKGFRHYLMRNSSAEYMYKGTTYRVKFKGADIFPQGFAAIADRLSEFDGTTMLCDIGNGTMNVMYINDSVPDAARCYTEKYGTQQCVIAAQNDVSAKHQAVIDEAIINRIMRYGNADIDEHILATVRNSVENYVKGIFRKLHELGYDPKLMKLFIVGGGGCLVRLFGEYDEKRVSILGDICAAAKGYEWLSANVLSSGR